MLDIEISPNHSLRLNASVPSRTWVATVRPCNGYIRILGHIMDTTIFVWVHQPSATKWLNQGVVVFSGRE